MINTYKAVIAGTGAYLPEKVLTNQDLEKILDTSNEWIIERTGISERRIAAEHESASTMAAKAAKQNAAVLKAVTLYPVKRTLSS